MKEKLILIGAGGYSKSVIDSLDFGKYEVFGFIDDVKSGSHLGYKILGNEIEKIENKENYVYFISIGDNNKRKYWYKKILKYNLKIINIIDKNAILSKNITYGRGIFIGKSAIVNSDVKIGENVIINTRSLLEHGSSIGNHSNVSTNTVINGDVKIGNNCFIGSCSVVIGQKKIGDSVIVGAGSVVINDIENNSTVVGVPAKEIKK